MMKLRTTQYLCSLALMALLLLSSCAKAPRPLEHTASAETYLNLAAETEGTEKANLLLKAARLAIRSENTTLAAAAINDLPQDLPETMLIDKQLMLSSLYLAKHHPTQSMRCLNALKQHHSLSQNQSFTWHQLAAATYRQEGKLADSLEELINASTYLDTKSEQSSYRLKIWDAIQSISSERIELLLNQDLSTALKGWLQLAKIIKNTASSPSVFARNLMAWEANYSEHPAQQLIPKNLFKLMDYNTKDIHHIALLLPTTGKYKSYANAIKNGFLTAFYQKEEGFSPSFKIYNTDNKEMAKLYQLATDEGADFVVGPLSKQHVTDLLEHGKLTVPTLLLNQSRQHTTTTPSEHMYLFSLSPLDELGQITTKAFNDGHRNALIIAPDANWGLEISDRFSQRWNDMGGNVMDTLRYHAKSSLALQISTVMRTHESIQTRYQLKRILHSHRKKLRFVARRRQDIDMIFLVATPNVARQIRPLLNFYFAGNLPVFSISTIYTGTENPRKDHDLDGIQFCDMPWVINTNWLHPSKLNAIRLRAKQTWPTLYARYPKLFAFGVDVYHLIPNLTRMSFFPEFGLEAATGRLFMNHHTIRRDSTWAIFKRGIAKPLS